MNRLKLPNTAAYDERKCAYLLPVKVLKTFGDVQNPEKLLKPEKYQRETELSGIRDRVP